MSDEIIMRECKVLDLDYPFTAGELTHAFRSKAFKHHPDKGGNPEKFIAITKAYEFLSSFVTKDSTENGSKNFEEDLTITPKMDLRDAHDLVRSILPMCYFDSHHCVDGINALRGYKKKFDEKNRTHLDQPVRNWAKHGADAFKTGAYQVDAMRTAKIWTAPTVNRALTSGMSILNNMQEIHSASMGV